MKQGDDGASVAEIYRKAGITALAPMPVQWRPALGAHDGAVNHQILIVSICRQCLEDPFPHAGMAPATKTAVHRFPFAVSLRQIASMHAGTVAPANIR